jgi:hypothetical protein
LPVQFLCHGPGEQAGQQPTERPTDSWGHFVHRQALEHGNIGPRSVASRTARHDFTTGVEYVVARIEETPANGASVAVPDDSTHLPVPPARQLHGPVGGDIEARVHACGPVIFGQHANVHRFSARLLPVSLNALRLRPQRPAFFCAL